ncbi:MAG: adenylate/guanylate cyclase domain-containing protein, partial [Actinomycetota bacterium]|nr:adenylate/guanylate cyclase domain-containing protein [Actinomycetota bacterium]
MKDLPTGTVTFLFTDIEGSTRMLERLGDDYRQVLEDHSALLRQAVEEAGGTEVSTEGDAFFCVFPTAPQGVMAAVAAQRALHQHHWPAGGEARVRMGLHAGTGALAGEDYVGMDVNRTARITAAAHGGQVLCSASTRSLVEHAVPSGVGFRDLGEHRLPDLSSREHLYQLVVAGLPDTFPPVRSLDRIPNNLPVQLTSFVGRRREVDQAVELLSRSRLLTLTGPGGTGKTRLALRVAAEVAEHFPHGVCFVPLAAITEPELVPLAIIEGLHLHQRSTSPLGQLLDYLADKEMLLVLDNFEQVLAAGPQVAQLLQGTTGLEVLVTSRAPLHVSGEQEMPVPSLRRPGAGDLPIEQLAQYEAVTLFVERAAGARPEFRMTSDNAAAVAQIVHRLEG